MKSNCDYITRLFIAIVVMIIPLFLSYHLIKGVSYTILTILCFIVAVIICNISNRKIIKVQFDKEFLLAFMMFVLLQGLAFINGYIIDGFFVTNDIFNIIGKAVMIYTFVAIPSKHVVSKDGFITFVKNFTILSLVVCLYNILDNYSLIINFFNISNSYQFNVTGVFANRNQFGSFMFISIIAHTYYNSQKNISKSDYIIYAIQFVNLILSMSRGAMLATGIFLFFYYGVFSRFLSKHHIIFLISASVVGLILLNDRIMNFIQNNLIRSEVGNSGRSEVWSTGIGIAGNKFTSLFIGQGLFHGVSIAQSNGMPFDQFHSFYVDTLVSGGIVELAFLVILFMYIVKKIFKCSNTKLKQVYLSSFVGYFMLCFFESDSVLSIGYVDMINTIFFVTIPLVLSNIIDEKLEMKEQHTSHSIIQAGESY